MRESVMKRQVDAAIIGGGPAGLAAAVELWNKGIHNILILEREKQLGGILRQCIHDGFGLSRFGTALTGPEYAQRFIDQVQSLGIPYLVNTAVIRLTGDKTITAATRSGILEITTKAVVLAMGCRERTRGALAIPGERPAGVFTAGTAQAYINLYNRMPAREVVILGSGDIGMIMARRLTLEGAHVKAMYEVMPIPSGLPRNIEQCLHDYNIPLYLSHTVTNIHGDRRLTGVTVSEVDGDLRPVPGTEQEVSCDTLILSVGLIPENELSKEAGVKLDPRTRGAIVDEHYQTSVPGIFSAGNVLHVHDLVDFVSLEAEKLADSVAEYVQSGSLPSCPLEIHYDSSLNHTVPMRASGKEGFRLAARVSHPIQNAVISVTQNGKVIKKTFVKKALPAEMIQFDVPGNALADSGDLYVTAKGFGPKAR